MKSTYFSQTTDILKAINLNVVILLFFNFLCITLLYFAGITANIISNVPKESNIIAWDAFFYKQIKDIGYIYIPSQPSNMAFFPLFPVFWKLSGFSGVQMSIFNIFLYMFSFSLLIGKEKNDKIYLLVLTSMPCFIFFCLPYSEALFFFFGTLLILGYKKDSQALLIAGILGCCLTRAVSTFFIPIFIFIEIYFWNGKASVRHLIIHCATAMSSILIIVLVQFFQTGQWFYYLKVAKLFNRNFMLPSVPFTTISPAKIMGIDAVACIFGAIAFYFCAKWAILFLRAHFSNKMKPRLYNKSIYFSALFLAAVFTVDTLFTNKAGGQTNIWSISRHLLCTPFAICFINWIHKDYKQGQFDIYLIILILSGGLFITGVLRYQIHFWFYILFVSSLVISRFIRNTTLFHYPLYLFNMILFVLFFSDYLGFKWVG